MAAGLAPMRWIPQKWGSGGFDAQIESCSHTAWGRRRGCGWLVGLAGQWERKGGGRFAQLVPRTAVGGLLLRVWLPAGPPAELICSVRARGRLRGKTSRPTPRAGPNSREEQLGHSGQKPERARFSFFISKAIFKSTFKLVWKHFQFLVKTTHLKNTNAPAWMHTNVAKL
jgi:hypothetical protein